MISLNSTELIKVLENTPIDQNIMLVGNHGIGKSQILTKYYESKGMKVVALFLGQMSDPGDLIGLPSLDEKTGRTTFMAPYWWPKDNEPIVLFLDELNRARPEMLQSVMDLSLNRKLAGRQLPAGSRIISAVNDGEEYQVGELDPALVSRFNIYKFSPSVREWIDWAIKNDVDERITNFIKNNKDYLDMKKGSEENALDKSPDRRAWVRVSDIVKGVEVLGAIHRKLIAGIVGVKAQNKFIEFISEKLRVTAKDLLTAKEFKKLIPDINKLSIPEMTILNEDIFRELENNELMTTDNVILYLELLKKTKKNEVIGHFVNFMTDYTVYENANKKIAKNKKIMDFMNDFVLSI